jgi:hypothetical protein
VRKGTGKHQKNYLSSSIKNRHVELLAQQTDPSDEEGTEKPGGTLQMEPDLQG